MGGRVAVSGTGKKNVNRNLWVQEVRASRRASRAGHAAEQDHLPASPGFFLFDQHFPLVFLILLYRSFPVQPLPPSVAAVAVELFLLLLPTHFFFSIFLHTSHIVFLIVFHVPETYEQTKLRGKFKLIVASTPVSVPCITGFPKKTRRSKTQP